MEWDRGAVLAGVGARGGRAGPAGRVQLLAPHHVRLLGAPLVAFVGDPHRARDAGEMRRGDRAFRGAAAGRARHRLTAQAHPPPVAERSVAVADIVVERHYLPSPAHFPHAPPATSPPTTPNT